MYSELWMLCLVCRVVLCSLTRVLVLADDGRVRGVRAPFTNQYKYLGIPYATAQRFQPPEPPRKWSGILNAINPSAACPQAISYLLIGNEDCLYLDVHTPAANATLLPVMVFIHGGAYYHGAKYHYDPAFLVTNDVIVVIINYRLGVLGFLCINGVSNIGIRDQIAALEWVQRNIKHFGGDPDNVTLFGQSAGASAAAMHLLINQSKRLFHKLILQSGNPLAPWAFTIDPIQSSVTDAMALGAKSDNEREMYETFRNASLYNLLVATKDTSINTKHFKYSPCVDGDLFTDTPYNILKSGNYNKVPVIVGTTDNEGLLFYGLHNDDTLKDFNDHFNDKLPSVFDNCPTDIRTQISNKLREYYFSNRSIDRMSYRAISAYYGDWLAYSTGGQFTDLLSSAMVSVYSYIFSYSGDRNIGKFWFTPAQVNDDGASHTDDVFYVFKPLGITMVLTSRDKLIIDRMSAMWSHFATTGDPTPFGSNLLPIKWQPYNINKEVLNIDINMRMMKVPKRLSGEYLRGLLCQYGESGFVPCETQNMCHANSK